MVHLNKKGGKMQEPADIKKIEAEVLKEFHETYCHWTDDMVNNEVQKRLKALST